MECLVRLNHSKCYHFGHTETALVPSLQFFINQISTHTSRVVDIGVAGPGWSR